MFLSFLQIIQGLLKNPRRHKRRRFESTHAPTHTNTADNRTQMHLNHPHESLPLAHKPPTWAASPILFFQRQCLHHNRMHVQTLNTNRHTPHTHIDTHAPCTIHKNHEHAHTYTTPYHSHNMSVKNGTTLIAVTSDEEHEGT